MGLMTEKEVEQHAELKEIERTKVPSVKVVKKIQRQKEVKVSQEQE